MCLRFAALIAAVTCLSARDVSAEWPMFRGDAARSGYTATSLPAGLSLRWQSDARHRPVPAWSGRDTRMDFDRTYHPVVSGGRLFFGSSADFAVHALDASSGDEVWRFPTDGPVRLPPAVWEGRVYAVSDDGFLYCLDGGDGHLLWKHRGGPSDSLVIGNSRIISRWPARGGPVVAAGTVYYGVGIWPSEGVAIYALDGKSGKPIWSNQVSGWLAMPQPHPGANAISGISAQGSLVATEDLLFVPTGRAVPAVFRRTDGELLYFRLQAYGHNGGADIVAGEGYFLNGGGLFEADGGQLLGRGVPTASAVMTPEWIVYVEGAEIRALDRARPAVVREGKDAGGRTVRQRSLAEPLWRVAAPHPSTCVAVADDTLIVGGEGRISLLRIPAGELRSEFGVEGTVLGLAVAEGRLFACTDRGGIYCFGADEGPDTVAAPVREPAPRQEPGGPMAEAAMEVLQRTGAVQGYAVDIGCGDGSLMLGLVRRSELYVIGVDDDPALVAQARDRLGAAGVYGVRAVVLQSPLESTALPERFANLVVSARSVSGTVAPGASAEIERILHPFGGKACVGRPGQMAVTAADGLPGAGSWTHQYGDPANSNCSGDELVHGPLGMQWFEDHGFRVPSRHGRGPAPLFHAGRLFVEGVDGLLCVDACNGRRLWELPLKGVLEAYDAEHIMGASGTGSNFCVTGDGVYLSTGDKCLRIDPETGAVRAEYVPPPNTDGSPGRWGFIACDDGQLFGTLARTKHLVRWVWRPGDMSSQFTESALLFAMSSATGSLLWTFAPEHSIRNNTIAIGPDRVYLIDRPVAQTDTFALQQNPLPEGETPAAHGTGILKALDRKTGQCVWRQEEGIYGTLLALSREHDVLLMSYQSTRFKLPSEAGGRMAAFRASTGEPLWDVAANYGSRPVLNGRTVYAQPGEWDLLTGEATDFTFDRSYGCGTVAGSKQMMVFRSATLGYTDLSADRGTENYGGIRPGCWINAIPAGGMVLMPDATDRCSCSYLNKASIALRPYGVRRPVVSPAGGASATPVTVSLAAGAAGTDIRYTLDGSLPDPNSTRYEAPVEIASSTTLRARAFRAGSPPSPVAEAVFTIDPALVPVGGPLWSVVDAVGAAPPQSRWTVDGGTVTEESNLYKGDARDPDPGMERLGSLRLYDPTAEFADGEFTVQLASSDNDSLGVVFRCAAPDRYYLWAMDQQRGFHALVCKDGDSHRVLATNDRGYEPGRWYDIRVVLRGDTLTVYVDGEKDLEAVDSAIPAGKLGSYAWGCAGAAFRGLRVLPAPEAPAAPR